ncbi:hypothetical protein FVE85_8221 [Porphyridium purpureum]|uniref:Tbc2 translation factor, chloroplastic n=1 Tax=Porphyridium purpureum TaxID=35688 RepID=A0A5J4YJY5_PORPP|nr:hypothetical protein FVE85_8221 [Porphyridium purpureum]|eukprot:POR7043..scf244_11
MDGVDEEIEAMVRGRAGAWVVPSAAQVAVKSRVATARAGWRNAAPDAVRAALCGRSDRRQSKRGVRMCVSELGKHARLIGTQEKTSHRQVYRKTKTKRAFHERVRQMETFVKSAPDKYQRMQRFCALLQLVQSDTTHFLSGSVDERESSTELALGSDDPDRDGTEVKQQGRSLSELIVLLRAVCHVLASTRAKSQHEEMRRILRESGFLEHWSTGALCCLDNSRAQVHPVQLCSLLNAFGKLEVAPPPKLLDALQSACMPFRRFDARGLANVIWSFARFGIRPRAEVLDDWCSACEAHMTAMNSLELAQIIWACAKLELNLPGTLRQSWTCHFQEVAHQLQAQHLSMTMWAFAVMYMESSQKLDAFTKDSVRVCLEQFPRLSVDLKAQECSTILWACARLRLNVTDDFQNCWYAMFVRLASEMSLQSLSNSIWAFARLDWKPTGRPANELLAALSRTEVLLSASPPALATIMWSFGKMKWQMPRELVQKWHELAKRQVKQFNSQAAVSSIWGMSALNISRTNENVFSFWMATALRQIPHMNGKELTCLLTSIARTQYVLPRLSLLRIQHAFLRLERSETASSQTLASFMWAFARLKVRPEPAVLREWSDRVSLCVPSFSLQAVVISLWSMARLNVSVAPSLTEKLMARFEQLAHHTNFQDVTLIMWALAKLDVNVTESFYARWNEAFKRELVAATNLGQTQSLDMIKWAMEKLSEKLFVRDILLGVRVAKMDEMQM